VLKTSVERNVSQLVNKTKKVKEKLVNCIHQQVSKDETFPKYETE
jgi:hypothetical protein